MKDMILFEKFAKGKPKTELKTANCVIYTRVSTKEQADNNMSLSTQKKSCELYAQKNGFTVLGNFGGTYESAQTDERKEFNRMLSLVKKSKEKISYIIVYSVDRFSRSGANAIYIKEQLKKQGVHIQSVTQPTDAETSSGSLQQNIQFIFSEYDNQLRREKCMSGVKEALLRGEWCHAAPIGYDSIRINGKRKLVINAKGKLLKKAFHWKADERLSSEDIRARLKALGLEVPNQTMSGIFHNPFYCGLLVHRSLEGKVVKGNHEPLITQEMFLRIHNIMSQKRGSGYTCKAQNVAIPLKNFLKCAKCGSNIPGYLVKKKNLWYYKCRTKNCCTNKSAKKLHLVFENIIEPLSITHPGLVELMGKHLKDIYTSKRVNNDELTDNLKNTVEEITKKLVRLEERFIEEEITRDLYVKYAEKYKSEKRELETQTASLVHKQVSDLDTAVDKAIYLTGNLRQLWLSGNYTQKKKLQYLLFPEGIHFNKESDSCRIKSMNGAMLAICLFRQDSEGNKKGIPELGLRYPDLVV